MSRHSEQRVGYLFQSAVHAQSVIDIVGVFRFVRLIPVLFADKFGGPVLGVQALQVRDPCCYSLADVPKILGILIATFEFQIDHHVVEELFGAPVRDGRHDGPLRRSLTEFALD